MADGDDSDAATALALHQQGRLAEAETIYRRVLAGEPDNADVLSLLGTLQYQTGRHEAAVEHLRRAIALKPGQAAWLANLGVALRALERYPEAAEALRQALAIRPDYPEALSNLGLVLHQMSEFAEAIASFERAIAMKPQMGGFHLNLGTTYLHLEQHEKAAECFRTALTLNPRHAAARSNLGVALAKLGQVKAAEVEMRAAVEIKPDSAEAWRGLALTLREQGRMAEALEAYERAVDIEPENKEGRQGLIFVENYLGTGTPAEAADRARRFAASLSGPSGSSYANAPDPDRVLRVGFVSADFRRHPVAQFLGHLLPLFDRHELEITLYANQAAGDHITAQFKNDADHWQPIKHLDDGAAEELIRSNGTDILIDLSGHTGGNRLPLFARRPAPVQAAWLGYSGTTGLSAIDYIIADANVIPPGDEANFSESPMRLPDAYLCYAPPSLTGLTAEIAPPPVLANGFITFGSYNKLDKMSDAAVACWARVLHAVPGSRLLLKSAPLDTAEVRGATEARFAGHGIAGDRLLLNPQNPSYLLHFLSYSEIDICLDPFPYNGTTTSCDALWMGVPMVSLVGDRFIARVGSSLLRAVGLGDLVADNVEDYVAIAARLAADVPRLQRVRATLRDDLLKSPLGDAPRFARNFEAALRQMWRTWCAAQQERAAS
jgi:predicted O-linked N-acetylglucosamine transferase (SPINDLY family)